MASRSGNQSSQPRSLNMNTFTAQQNARQTSRLQNTQKTGLGNGNAGTNWAFGAPSSFGAAAAGGGVGTGGAPGLTAAPARPGQLSGFAQVMGGGSGQGPIDMSDFPTLSGAPRPQLPSNTSTSMGSTWNSGAIRQPSSSQPPQAQIPQARAPSTAPSLEQQQQQQPAAAYASADAADLASHTQQQESGAAAAAAATGEAQAATQSGQPWGDLSEKDRWGMAGLEAMFRYRRDRENGLVGDAALPQGQKTQAMLMGHDLSTAALGLDLESLEPLYPTFSVFGDLYDGTESSLAHRRPIPDFPLSESYRVNNVPSLLPRMSAMSDETLFFAFYQNPRGLEQEQAGIELHARFWRWHKILRKWLQKDTREANVATTPLLVDLTNGAPVDGAVTRPSVNTERGVFIFFEPTPHWRRERREFTLNYEELDHRQGGDNAFGPGVAGL